MGRLDVIGQSADVDNPFALRLHFRMPVTDLDRADVLSALNQFRDDGSADLRREVELYKRLAHDALAAGDNARKTLTRIAEWAETADAQEAVAGLAQTAQIARLALQAPGGED